MAKLVRTLAGYAECSADAIASGSKAQVMYFIDDAKADIATLAAENERLKAIIAEAIAALDGCPEYHYSGMGCGLEDRGIRDRYDAMHHGWECAMDRAYSEHVIPAKEALEKSNV